jgi:hypothetical protein
MAAQLVVTLAVLSSTELTLITTKLLDFVHRPDFYKPENTTFRKLDLFPSSEGGGALTLQKTQKLAFPQAMPEQKKVNHWNVECRM